VRELTLIGEAANQVSATIRDEHAVLPWKRLIQLRHFYVHGYRRLDFRQVWRDTTRLVAQLPPALTLLLPSDVEGDALPGSP